jgi:hypothetical protein
MFSGLSDGTRYYFRVSAQDAFFHLSFYSNYVYTTPDASPPLDPSLLLLPTYSAGLQRALEWAPTFDLGAGGIEYFAEASLDSNFLNGSVVSGWITATQFTFVGLSDGQTYYYRLKARDALGHESGWSPTEHSTQDNGSPFVLADFVTIVIDSGDFLLTGTAADEVSGVESVFYSQDSGATWVAANGTTSWRAPITGLVEGNWYVLIQSVDGVGYGSIIFSVLISVDATAPIIAFQAPTNGSLLSGLVGVYALVSDPHFQNFSLQTRKNGTANFTNLVANGSLVRGDNFLALWDTSKMANGAYDLRLNARDTLGHLSVRTITVRLLNSDLAVTYNDLEFSDRAPLRGDRINVTGVVSNYGTARAENVTVRITDNGNTVFEDRITIDEHSSYTAFASWRINSTGAHNFRLEVEYPEGSLDEGLETTSIIVASEPPAPVPPPFLVEYAGAFSLASVIAILALAFVTFWSMNEIRRIRTQPGGGAAFYASEHPDNIDVQWESDEMF